MAHDQDARLGKLGFHYHVPAVYQGGRVCTPGFQGRFIDSLAEFCEEVVCFLHSPVQGETELLDYPIQNLNVQLVDLGPHNSLPKRLMRARKIRGVLAGWREKLDVILLRGPSPLLPLFGKVFDAIPTAVLVVGDNTAGIDDLPQPWWRKELIRAWEQRNKRQQIALMKRGLAFVNSRQRYEEFQPLVPNLVETRTTSLSRSDFFLREDTCTAPPYRLLYTGRIDQAKGLFELVRAVSMLKEEGLDVNLDLVGPPQKNDPVLEEIEEFSRTAGISESIHYHGYQPLGPKLFTFYQSADIYVLPSKSDFEGFPRSIWEAMAHSLPVVATKVGSIPFYLDNGKDALLVEPRRPEEIARAIKRIIGNRQLRRRLIQKGFRIAKENTLETRTEELVSRIACWVEKEK